ncbi:MAG: Glutamine--fructose-6-phosphate aminotransferase [isomerizing] [Methanonatronarchaeales archaeon]|nr:Glutamine--fructose-6-phosphate aminotransferase [isomerizing] [Methanonatronarchaeales archaeon]
MCGIVGAVSGSEVAPVLVDALKRLEYRGYDSAGLATYAGSLSVSKGVGRMETLDEALGLSGMEGRAGVGHTRWATHGKPSEGNAHPHTDCDGDLAVVHNGIVENYAELREGLEERGHVFSSYTDTEVVPHLLEERLDGSLEHALRETVSELEGSFAICAVGEDGLVAARNGSPLVIGLSDDANFVASDVPAILPYTRRVKYLLDGEMAVIKRDSVEVRDFDGEPVEREEEVVEWDAEEAERGGYEHYMLKEIHEQPRALAECMGGRLDELMGEVDPGVALDRDGMEVLEGVEFVGCGTSYHAALYGARLTGEFTGLPVNARHASEYRYGPVSGKNILTVGITQSGETADTLRAIERAGDEGHAVLVLTNVVGSTATRMTDDVVYLRSGPEIGVAASKTFTNQLACVAMLAIALGRESGDLPRSEAKHLIAELRDMPSKVQRVLDEVEDVESVAESYVDSEAFFFIGRGVDYPVAMEGALKMKEISYVHSEGYPAGELKHGPLALITRRTPVVAVLTSSPLYEKTLSSAKEVEARDGPVIAVASESDEDTGRFCEEVLRVPDADHRLSPLLSTVVMQLFAYHVARELGRPIDRPRNLAKSVTVE